MRKKLIMLSFAMYVPAVLAHPEHNSYSDNVVATMLHMLTEHGYLIGLALLAFGMVGTFFVTRGK